MEIYNLVKLSIPKGYATISFDFATVGLKKSENNFNYFIRLDKQSKDDLRCLIDDLKNSSSSKIRDDKILLHFKTDACDYGYGISDNITVVTTLTKRETSNEINCELSLSFVPGSDNNLADSASQRFSWEEVTGEAESPVEIITILTNLAKGKKIMDFFATKNNAKNKRIHQETTKLIISHLRPSTIKVYLSGWNKWIKCCEKQGIDSEILEKSHLTNFLAEETKDKTASTVNLIKATVLKIFTLVNKPIEQENLLDHIIKDIHNKTYNMRAGRKVLFISTRQPFRELTVDRIKNNIKEYLTEAKGGNNACECKSAAISNDFWNKMSLEQLMEQIVKKLREEQTLNDLPRSRNPKIVHTKQNIQKVKENEEESMEIPLAVQSQELGINRETLRKIMTEDLDLKLYKLQYRQT
uniref:Uncharacterized protein n=2 Tax=Strongyloides stercoralis TaxID=6248 RepID=A0AAF5DQZ0_STRER